MFERLRHPDSLLTQTTIFWSGRMVADRASAAVGASKANLVMHLTQVRTPH